MKNKFTLTIAGCSIAVSTSETEEFVTQLAEQLNEEIKAVLASSKTLSFSNAAILCALDSLSKYKKADAAAANMRTQIKDYLSDAASSKVELNEQISKYNELFAEYNKIKSDSGLETVTARCDELAHSLARQIELTAQAASERAELEEKNSVLKQKLDEANKALSDVKDIAEKANEAKRAAEREAELSRELKEQYELALERNSKLKQQLELLEQMITEDNEERAAASMPAAEDIVEDAETQPEPEPEDEAIEPLAYEQIMLDEPEASFDGDNGELNETEDDAEPDNIEDAAGIPTTEEVIAEQDDTQPVTSPGHDPYITQRQVENLFSQLTQDKPKPQPKNPPLFDDDMPDLGWTKDI